MSIIANLNHLDDTYVTKRRKCFSEVTICVSRICPGIINEPSGKLVVLDLLEIPEEHIEDHKKNNSNRHIHWEKIKVYVTLDKIEEVWAPVLNPINSLSEEKVYYPSELEQWSPSGNQKELDKQENKKKFHKYYVTAMEI